jgi:hypothetical protein
VWSIRPSDRAAAAKMTRTAPSKLVGLRNYCLLGSVES